MYSLLKKKNISPYLSVLKITAEEALPNLLDVIAEYCPHLEIEKLTKKELMLLLQSYADCVIKYHPEHNHQERGALLENAEILRKYGLTDEDYRSLDFC